MKEVTKFELSVMNGSMTSLGHFMELGKISPKIGLILFAGNSLLAASSQVLGQIYERNYDGRMVRTCLRPIVTTKVSVNTASWIFGGLLLAGNAVLYPFVSFQSLLASNVTIASYMGYLKLKQLTPWSIGIGAVVGALPILAGALATVDWSNLSSDTYFHTGFLFLWQIQHFLAILYRYKSDYDKSGFEMIKSKDNIVAVSLICMASLVLLCLSLEAEDLYDQAVKGLLVVGSIASATPFYLSRFPGSPKYKFLRSRAPIYIIWSVYYFLYGLRKSIKRPFKKGSDSLAKQAAASA